RGRALSVAAGSPLMVASRSVRIVVTPFREDAEPGPGASAPGVPMGHQALSGWTSFARERNIDGPGVRPLHRREMEEIRRQAVRDDQPGHGPSPGHVPLCD